MSSTSTYLQLEAHAQTRMHMDRYPEMGSQQPYSDDGFGPQLTEYGFPADDSTYSAHAENLYDEARYNRLPPGIGLFGFEDAEPDAPAVVRYDRMQDTNYHTSPELRCPRPTLPPQFPPQFSSSNWPNEAPVNVYRTYSEPSGQRHTNSISHSSEAAEMRYSFENQQALSSPTFYPAAQEFADPAPNPISMPHYHGDGGYVHQPFFSSTPSSFERLGGPNHSISVQPKYHAAHQPILPEQRSSYSELAPNLTFMNSQAKPQVIRHEKIHTQDRYVPKNLRNDTITRTTTPSRDIKKNPFALGLNGPPLTAIGRKVTPPLSLNRVVRHNRDPVVSDHTMVDTTVPTPPSAATKTRSSRNVNEPRRPSLACTFCRERKIACGRPPEGSSDLTCNQCARRSFTCHYLDSKSAAPSVQSHTNSKDSSPPLKRK